MSKALEVVHAGYKLYCTVSCTKAATHYTVTKSCYSAPSRPIRVRLSVSSDAFSREKIRMYLCLNDDLKPEYFSALP